MLNSDSSIVVPVDTSELAERAIHVAADLAAALGAPLVVMTVVDSHVTDGITEFASAEQVDMFDAIESYFTHLTDPLRTRGIEVSFHQVSGKHPADDILHFVENHEVRMVVMSSHGRSGLSRWLLGSVAEKVVRSSDVPVVIVPVRQAA